jgi:hypothetical protein
MAMGIYDLSVVTDRLIEQLTTCMQVAWRDNHMTRFGLTFTGLAPEAVRTGNECMVSVYLFHAAVDKYHRNTYPTGGPAARTTQQPLALSLSYLVTAYAKNDYHKEQRAMSIALRCLHMHPVIRATAAGDEPEEDFTITIEPQSSDELGRLWQASTAAMRLSAVFRANVVFVTPPERALPPPVRHPPTFDEPRQVKPEVPPPASIVASATTDPYGLAAVVVPGAAFAAGVTTVTLRALPLFEVAAEPIPARRFLVETGSKLWLRVPLFTPAGEYLVTAVPDPDRPAIEIYLTVLELVQGVRTAAADAFTVALDDARFATATATVTLDAGTPGEVVLAQAGTTLQPGEFDVVDLDTIDVQLPTGTTVGRHYLKIAAEGVDPPRTLRLDVT